MSMNRKRGQTWSIETYLAIATFMIAIIFFYGLTTVKTMKSNVGIEVEKIGNALISSDELRDGHLSQDELDHFVSLNCTELKKLFQTNKELCIYLRDSDGNLILNGTHVIHGIGCPGVNISGRVCGNN